jgi:VWFA-related protein
LARRLTIVVALVACLQALPETRRDSQQPTFSSRVSAVRLDVSVRQGGESVRGLQADDFDVRDNGVRQQIELVGLERTPVNVVLALDMSGSVQGARLDQLRTAGERLIAALGGEDSAAVLAFTEVVAIRTGFTTDRAALIGALHEPAQGRDTALRDATHAALALGGSRSGRPLIILFSDGTDTSSFLSEDLVLTTARRTEPVVYAVTSVLAERDRFVDDVVRLTGGRRLEIPSLDRLSETFAEILGESRERYLLSYTPTGVAAGGWHEVDVRVPGRRAEVRARPGYLASP